MTLDVKTQPMSEKDVELLRLRAKKAMKNKRGLKIAAVVFLIIFWVPYIIVQDPGTLAAAVVGTAIVIFLAAFSMMMGKKLFLDLQERQKEVISGKVAEKNVIRFQHSTHHELVIDGQKIPVGTQAFSQFTEGDTAQIERSVHAHEILSAKKL